MMRSVKQQFSCVVLGLLLSAAVAPPAVCSDHAGVDTNNASVDIGRDARMKWWREARFGMFIHWNVSSVPAGVYHGKSNHFVGEWLMHDEKIPVAEYKEYARQFNPVKFSANEWVMLAKRAGMKYIVFTAKHHDGFAMYHSVVSDWNIVDATPFKRDILKELSAACRKHGIKLGVYYSHAADWTHPGGRVPAGAWDQAQVGDFDEYLHSIAVPQIREILTRYGPIAIMWWDASWEMTRERADMLKPLLGLQDGILMNDRLGGEYQGDFGTPEQSVPDRGATGRDWETCMTMNDSWGYKVHDDYWKSAETLIRFLADAASKGGNYLLNVGPTEAGAFPDKSVQRLKQIGDWMQRNGEAIHGTGVAQCDQPTWGRCTQKRDATGLAWYLLVFNWPADGRLTLSGSLPDKIEKAYLLGDSAKHALKVESTNSITTIEVPVAAPDGVCPVIVLRIKGTPCVAAAESAKSPATSVAKDQDTAPKESLSGKRPPAPPPEASWIPSGRLYAQQRLNLSRSEATDTTLTHLGELRGLSRLDLAYLKITDAGMESVRALTGLNMLTLTGSPITDAGLIPLATLPGLGVLVLDDTLITDAGAAELGKMTQVGELYLRNTKISDSGLEQLNHGLVRLYLAGTGITDAGLQSLKAFRRLTVLDLARTAISDSGLKDVATLKSLEELDLSGTSVSDAGLRHLQTLVNVRGLRLAGTKVTDVGVAELQRSLPDVTVHR